MTNLERNTKFREIAAEMAVFARQSLKNDSKIWRPGSQHRKSEGDQDKALEFAGETVLPVSHGSTRAVWRWGDYVIKVGSKWSNITPNYREWRVSQFVIGTPIEQYFAKTHDYFSAEPYTGAPGLSRLPMDFTLMDFVHDIPPSRWGAYTKEFTDHVNEMYPEAKQFFQVSDLCGFNLLTNPWLVFDYGAFYLVGEE